MRPFFYLAGQLAKHPSAMAVRLVVEPAGCSGHAHHIGPAEVSGDEDLVFEEHGLRIVINAAVMPYLQGTRLDVKHQGINGCGLSGLRDVVVRRPGVYENVAALFCVPLHCTAFDCDGEVARTP